MAKIYLQNNVSIFRSGENTILRTPTLVLRFFEPRMSQALCDVASALVKGCDQQFMMHTFLNRYSVPEVEKILELLRRYNLLHTGSAASESRDAVQRRFSLRGPFLTEDLEKGFGLWPSVELLNNCKEVSAALDEQAIAALPEDVTPVFLFSEYRRDEFEKLNKVFVRKRKDWGIVLRFFEDIFIVPFRSSTSPCFTCLPPLSISERVVDSIAVSTTAEFEPSAKATATSFVMRELTRMYAPDSDSHLHVLRLNPVSGDSHRILRVRDPLCQSCGQGSL